MSTPLNGQEFYLKTKAFERQACDKALEQARALSATTPSHKTRRVVMRLSDEAYVSFSERLNDTFAAQDCEDLISLTLMSRENLFFLNLKAKLTAIFEEATKQTDGS